MAWRVPSQRDQPEGWVKPAQVPGVGGDDWLAGAAGADHDVGIGNVRGPAGPQQPADVSRVYPAQSDNAGARLADQP